MISIIITSYKEPKTVGLAIESVLKNKLDKEFEIIVVAPDDETLEAAKKYSIKNKNVKTLKDTGNGKPAALNLVVSKAKGEILILTDGDVYVGENALKPLLAPLENQKNGSVSGNPVSTSPKNNMLGFWAYMLTEIASKRRINASNKGKRLFCSGYLFAIRKKLFPKLKAEILSEDGFISHNVYEKGYSIAYSEKSKVFVKYPSNFKDWIKQKRRSAGGYNQIKKMIGVEIRSFKSESLGALAFFKFVSNIKEFAWLFALFFSRIYLWFLIYKDINFKKKSKEEIWVRIESTK